MSAMTTLLLLTTSDGILPLLLAKIVALKALIFLGPPLTLGSFILGHGSGLLLGELLGIDYLLNKWYGKKHTHHYHPRHHHHHHYGWKPDRPTILLRLSWILKDIFHRGYEDHPPIFPHPPDYYKTHYHDYNHHHKYKHTHHHRPSASIDDEHINSPPALFDDEHEHPHLPPFNIKHKNAVPFDPPNSFADSLKQKHIPLEFFYPPGSKSQSYSLGLGEQLGDAKQYRPVGTDSESNDHVYDPPLEYNANSNKHISPEILENFFKLTEESEQYKNLNPETYYENEASESNKYSRRSDTSNGGSLIVSQSQSSRPTQPSSKDFEQLAEEVIIEQILKSRNKIKPGDERIKLLGRILKRQFTLEFIESSKNKRTEKVPELFPVANYTIIAQSANNSTSTTTQKLISIEPEKTNKNAESVNNSTSTQKPILMELVEQTNKIALSVNNSTTIKKPLEPENTDKIANSANNTTTTTTQKPISMEPEKTNKTAQFVNNSITTQKPISIETEKSNTSDSKPCTKKKNTSSALWDVLSNLSPSETVPVSVLKWMLEHADPDTRESIPEVVGETTSTNRTKRHSKNAELEELEQEEKILNLTNIFMRDVHRLFSIVSLVDINRCLEKMVCDLHSRADDPGRELSSYESNIISAFKVMDGIMPYSTTKKGDSSRKYRKAAKYGKITKSPRSCQLAFPSCSTDSNSIISFGNIGESNKDLK